jgi:glycosyltransferase involved in cell wall biosynthesis
VRISCRSKIHPLMTEKTRITHVITGLATGGAETMLLKLLKNIDNDQFENSVISLTGAGPIGERIRELGITLTVLGMNRSLSTPWDLLRLCWQIRRHRPHVVQTWLYHADLLGFVFAKIAGVKKVAWNIRCSYMGEDYYRGFSGLLIRILAAISGRPDAVVVNSTSGKTLHQSLGYHPQNWMVIPNGFDVDIFQSSLVERSRIRQELKIPASAPVIGLVGRWDPVKGHDLFLQAAASFLKQHPESHFIIVGKDCTPENLALLKLVDANVKPNLHLLGERHDIPAITAALDLSVCASIGEGFPNVIGEAMACEVPCVATDVGDCADIIADTGYVVASGNVKEMTMAWLEIFSLSPSASKQLGVRARNRIREAYSIQKIVATYQELYQVLRHSGD